LPFLKDWGILRIIRRTDMDTVWLVEVSNIAVRAFADKARAEQYVQCMLEETDVDDSPMYAPYEIEIVSLEIEK
jgi:hypothetical protein